MERLSEKESETPEKLLEFDLFAELKNGVAVRNLALVRNWGCPMRSATSLRWQECSMILES